MATQCEAKRDLLRVRAVTRCASLNSRVRVREAIKRSSSSPPAIRSNIGKAPTSSPRLTLLIPEPPQAERNTGSPQPDTATPSSAEPQCSIESYTTEQDTDLSEGELTHRLNTETKLSSRNNSFLRISHATDDPSDSDKEKNVSKVR